MRRYTIEVAGRVRVVDVEELAADRFRVLADGHELEVRVRRAEDLAACPAPWWRCTCSPGRR
jgi:hypothetical protein